MILPPLVFPALAVDFHFVLMNPVSSIIGFVEKPGQRYIHFTLVIYRRRKVSYIGPCMHVSTQRMFKTNWFVLVTTVSYSSKNFSGRALIYLLRP
jgi:hypothetical protein